MLRSKIEHSITMPQLSKCVCVYVCPVTAGLGGTPLQGILEESALEDTSPCVAVTRSSMDLHGAATAEPSVVSEADPVPDEDLYDQVRTVFVLAHLTASMHVTTLVVPDEDLYDQVCAVMCVTLYLVDKMCMSGHYSA